MVSCFVCNAELPAHRSICDICAAQLANPRGLCLEHILWVGRSPKRRNVALIDSWGRPHYLRDTTLMGREPDDGIAVLESSVSRQHAKLTHSDGVWQIRDLGSSNGTLVGTTEVTEVSTRLSSGDKLVIGDVALYFVAHDRLLEGVEGAGKGTAPARNRSGSPLEEIIVRLAAPTARGGGSVELAGTCVHLSPIQFEFIRVLVDHMLADAASPHTVRGFVSSPTLLSSLPWDAAFPTDNNLKQLVRRVRKAMAAVGIEDIIESRQGIGYRLQRIPRVA